MNVVIKMLNVHFVYYELNVDNKYEYHILLHTFIILTM